MKTYSGRIFSQSDIELIRALVTDNPSISRRRLSKAICEAIDWRNPSGALKDMRCRVVLLEMERDGLIKLPPVKKKFPSPQAIIKNTLATDPSSIITKPVHELGPLELKIVDNYALSKLWNEFIHRYHYLGYKKLPGHQLRYIVFSGPEVIALLGFGAAAWKTAPRDKAIGWTTEQRKNKLHLVVNNARFLILPWIQSKNLASKILSLVAKRLPEDWYERYHYKPVLIETFVEIPRFTGGCYKAANWVHVGTTTGRGRNDQKHQAKLPKKDIWLFPLHKRFRRALCSDSE